MYQNYNNHHNYYTYPGNPNFVTSTIPNILYNEDSDRIIGGGVLAPFILGGIAGAAISPWIWNRPYRPCCYYPPYYYPPYGRCCF